MLPMVCSPFTKPPAHHSSARGSTTSQSANLLFFGDVKFYGGVTLGGPIGQQFWVDYADVVNVGTRAGSFSPMSRCRSVRLS